MKNEMKIGGGEIINEFIRELVLVPHEYKEVVVASPFVDFEKNEISKQLLSCLLQINNNGGTVMLISELTDQRNKIFSNAVRDNFRNKEILYLAPNLHAKFGFALRRDGAWVAFIGSANLTTAAVKRNTESVLMIKNFFSQNADFWNIARDINIWVKKLKLFSIESSRLEETITRRIA